MARRVGNVRDARMPEGIPRKANRTESEKSRVAFFRGGGCGVVHVRVDDVEMRGKRGNPLFNKNARMSKMLAGSAGRREGGGQAKADGRRSEGDGEAGRRYIYAQREGRGLRRVPLYPWSFQGLPWSRQRTST